jgi:hypothetical protein
MATATSKNDTFIPDLEAAGERVREANERFIDASRKITNAYLDGVERYVAGVAQFERKLGAQSTIEPVAGLLNAHAKLTEDVSKASISAARELLTV